MKLCKKLAFLVVLMTACMNAAADTQEQTYQEGPFMSIDSNRNGFYTGNTDVNFGIFWGQNNQWSLSIGGRPVDFDQTKYRLIDIDGFSDSVTWSMFVQGRLMYYASIARKFFKNRTFFYCGPGWMQTFMPTRSSNGTYTTTRSFWIVSADFGLQYRFNGNFYIGARTPFFSYEKNTRVLYNNFVRTEATKFIDWYFWGGTVTFDVFWKF